MCYSAEAWTLYKQYVDEFGADIDIKAFRETYLGRDEKYRIRKKLSDGTKIPKGMDLNFLHPKSELEQEIHALIQQWNERKISESEQELFKQVKRVADAERKLAVKEQGAFARSKCSTQTFSERRSIVPLPFSTPSENVAGL